MERIWDRETGEFMKSFRQAKDFRQYLEFLKDFGIMEQILPGLNVDIDIKNQDSIELVLAQMLKNNDTKLLSKSMNKFSIPTDIINKVVFLIDFLDFDPNDVYDTYKSKVRFKVDNETIDNWLKVNNIQHHAINKFILYTPSLKSVDVMRDYNLKPSKELGDKIKELESELFKNL